MYLRDYKEDMLQSEIDFIDENFKKEDIFNTKLKNCTNVWENKHATIEIYIKDEDVCVSATQKVKGYYPVQFDEEEYVYGQFEQG